MIVNMRGSSLKLKKNHSFFDNMKRMTPDLFEHITSLSTNSLVDGYKAYQKEIEGLVDTFHGLYNELDDRSHISKFSRFYGCGYHKIRNMGVQLGNGAVRYKTYKLLKDMNYKMEWFINNRPKKIKG